MKSVHERDQESHGRPRWRALGHSSALRARVAQALAVLLTLGCPLQPDEPKCPDWTLHEWGLIELVQNQEVGVVVATGALAPARPANTYKPVIYVHLGPGVEQLSASVQLTTLAGGVFDEVFPSGPRSPEDATVSWSFVATRHTHHYAYPSAGSARCQGLVGACEAASLVAVEVASAADLEIDGAHYNHLFYRGRVPLTPAPLTGDLRRFGFEGLTAPAFVVLPAAGGIRSETRAVRLPPDGTVSLFDELPLRADDVRRELLAASVSRGLTVEEATVMLDVWDEAFFGSERGNALTYEPFLVSFLSRDEVDRLYPLTSEPPARSVQRVFLLQMILTDVANPLDAPPEPS